MLLFWMRVMLVWRAIVGASLGLVKFERAFIQRVQLLVPVSMSLSFLPVVTYVYLSKCRRADEVVVGHLRLSFGLCSAMSLQQDEMPSSSWTRQEPTYQPTTIFTSGIHPNLARIDKSNQVGGLARSQKIVDTPKDAIPKDETHKHTTTFHLTTKTPHQLHPPSDSSIKITTLTLILPKETRSHRRILLGQCPTQAISRQCLLRPFSLRTLLDEGGNGASTRRRPNDERGASRAGQGCG
jgi:hypothetical protein